MKTIERKKSHGEVFTPRSLVLEMIEKIELAPDKTFLDNSCGNAQFLIELLKRGIPLNNIYGVDIQRDNCMDTIARLVIYSLHGEDIVNENAQAVFPIEEIFNDDSEYLYSEYHHSTGIIYVREDSVFSTEAVGFFSWSEDQKVWNEINTIVRADALKYNYSFERKKIKNVLQF